MKIAALMTCHNRREITLKCLHSLFACELPKEYGLDVYLVDDGCTDGTATSVQATFPSVQIIIGSGDLYWSGGMRLAWKVAAESYDYDYYLWVNDDVELETFAIVEMLSIAENPDFAPIGAVVGSFSNRERTILTYGGFGRNVAVLPNGVPQKCKFVHGNFVLVPRAAYHKIGGFPDYLRHGLGDTDYGLRAARAGLACWTTTRIVGVCEVNSHEREWFDCNNTLKRRWQSYWSIKGGGGHELLKLRMRFFRIKWPFLFIKDIIHLICPWPFEFVLKSRGFYENKNRIIGR